MIAGDDCLASEAVWDAKHAFERLRHSGRREYVSWIEEAKQPTLRTKRNDGMIDRLRTNKG
jgi:uncharacterized protein YdeI (YjbR/CyaY-like superfamily)